VSRAELLIQSLEGDVVTTEMGINWLDVLAIKFRCCGNRLYGDL